MRKHMVKARQSKGFTLVELLVVVVIIGVLAAIAIPTFLSQRENAWDAAAESDAKNMATAQIAHQATDGNGSFTESLQDLKDAGFVPSLDDSEYDVNTAESNTEFQVCVQSESGTVFALAEDGDDGTEGCFTE